LHKNLVEVQRLDTELRHLTQLPKQSSNGLLLFGRHIHLRSEFARKVNAGQELSDFFRVLDELLLTLAYEQLGLLDTQFVLEKALQEIVVEVAKPLTAAVSPFEVLEFLLYLGDAQLAVCLLDHSEALCLPTKVLAVIRVELSVRLGLRMVETWGVAQRQQQGLNLATVSAGLAIDLPNLFETLGLL